MLHYNGEPIRLLRGDAGGITFEIRDHDAPLGPGGLEPAIIVASDPPVFPTLRWNEETQALDITDTPLFDLKCDKCESVKAEVSEKHRYITELGQRLEHGTLVQKDLVASIQEEVRLKQENRSLREQNHELQMKMLLSDSGFSEPYPPEDGWPFDIYPDTSLPKDEN